MGDGRGLGGGGGGGGGGGDDRIRRAVGLCNLCNARFVEILFPPSVNILSIIKKSC